MRHQCAEERPLALNHCPDHRNYSINNLQILKQRRFSANLTLKCSKNCCNVQCGTRYNGLLGENQGTQLCTLGYLFAVDFSLGRYICCTGNLKLKLLGTRQFAKNHLPNQKYQHCTFQWFWYLYDLLPVSHAMSRWHLNRSQDMAPTVFVL